MEDLAGTAVRVTRERYLADECAVVLAAGSIPHRPRGTRGWVGQPASVRLTTAPSGGEHAARRGDRC
jgi:hypothetical protein